MAGGVFVDVIVDEAHDPESTFPWKGNIDLDKLRAVVDEHGVDQVAYVSFEHSVNMAGGQPVSMDNMKEVYAYCAERAIPVFFDSTRSVENAWMIQANDFRYADTPRARHPARDDDVRRRVHGEREEGLPHQHRRRARVPGQRGVGAARPGAPAHLRGKRHRRRPVDRRPRRDRARRRGDGRRPLHPLAHPPDAGARTDASGGGRAHRHADRHARRVPGRPALPPAHRPGRVPGPAPRRGDLRGDGRACHGARQRLQGEEPGDRRELPARARAGASDDPPQGVHRRPHARPWRRGSFASGRSAKRCAGCASCTSRRSCGSSRGASSRSRVAARVGGGGGARSATRPLGRWWPGVGWLAPLPSLGRYARPSLAAERAPPPPPLVGPSRRSRLPRRRLGSFASAGAG